MSTPVPRPPLRLLAESVERRLDCGERTVLLALFMGKWWRIHEHPLFLWWKKMANPCKSILQWKNDGTSPNINETLHCGFYRRRSFTFFGWSSSWMSFPRKSTMTRETKKGGPVLLLLLLLEPLKHIQVCGDFCELCGKIWKLQDGVPKIAKLVYKWLDNGLW